MPGSSLTSASAWLLALLVGALGAGVEALAGGSLVVALVLPVGCAALVLHLHRTPGRRETLQQLPGGRWALAVVLLLVAAGLVARWALGESGASALLSAAALGGVLVPVVLAVRAGTGRGTESEIESGSGSTGSGPAGEAPSGPRSR